MKKEHEVSIRFFDFLSDYGDICNWWRDWKLAVIPVGFLPPTGFIAECNGKKIIAAFLYKSDSLVCRLDWFISDKKAAKRIVISGMDQIISSAIKHAQEEGFGLIYNSVDNKVILNRSLKNGYTIVETNRTNILRML